jgi:flagellar L-ring protein precursor FlgH
MIQKTMTAVAACILLFSAGAEADSLFNRAAEARGSLITDQIHRYQVGDIITVLVRESVDASTQANTSTKKESEIEAQASEADNPFLVGEGPDGLNILNPGELPNWNIEADSEHKGSGSTKRANSLVATIACMVTDALPNGNLRIEGQKKLTVNREDSELRIAGIIRTRDVSPSNTIASSQVANASVELIGRGPIWNTQRRGILSKVMDWFSPF